MSYEIDKIDSVDIYSFNGLEFLRDFVAKNNLTEYDLRTESPEHKKYNTRSRYSNSESKLNDTLNCYLNKLDSEGVLLDQTRDDLYSNSKRQTRSQSGKLTLPECGKTYCRLGCICEKTEAKKKCSNKHCGRFECMFECNCARSLRSSTRKKVSDTQKSSSGSVCSRSSSNSSTSVRKSKRSRNQVNYFYISKQGFSNDASNDARKVAKFKPYNDTVELIDSQELKLEILTKNYEILKFKILDFIKCFMLEFKSFTWKELNFSYEKTLSVHLSYKPLSAKITKFKLKDSTKNQRILDFLNMYPQFTVQSFKFKKNQANNKENTEPERPAYKILPRLLCRKSTKTVGKETELKKIFNNLDTLFRQVPKKYEKISDDVKSYRDLDKISLFNDEKDVLMNKKVYDFYNPFSDEDLVLASYRLVDSREIVDSVSSTLNDMISVVCTHKENVEKEKFDMNEFLPSVSCQSVQNYVRPNLLKKKSNNVIMVNKKDLSTSRPSILTNVVPFQQSGRTFVKILSAKEKNVMPISIMSKQVIEKPILKVNLNELKMVGSGASGLIKSVQESTKRKRKQDLSFLAKKIINVNTITSPLKQHEQNEKQQRILISNSLFHKAAKFVRNDSESFDDFNSISIKDEPTDTSFSDSTNYSQRYLTIADENDTDAQNYSETSSTSTFYEQKFSPSNMLSMLKFDYNTNSSYSNSDNMNINNNNNNNQKSSPSSCSFIPNNSYDDDDDESNDSDLENEDDFLNNSSSSKLSSNGGKNVSSNIHSVRERQRRFRLKNLLTKLKYTLYNIDENSPNIRNNPNLKHSKQATLAETVDLIKSMELNQQQMEEEYKALNKHHLYLKQRLNNLINN